MLDGDRAARSQHLDLGFRAGSLEVKVDRFAGEWHPLDRQLVEPRREGWLEEETALTRVRLEAEDRSEQQWNTAGGPSLRNVCLGIKDWPMSLGAAEPSPELGKPSVSKQATRAEDSLGDPICLLPMVVALHAEGDQRVVVRPDRAALVHQRCVGTVLARESANAPPVEHVIGKEPTAYLRGTIGRNDPGPEQLPRVRGDRPNRPLLRIQAVGVEPFVRQPVASIELGVKPLGALCGSVGFRGFAEDPVKLGCAAERIVIVALNLDDR